MQLAVRFHFSLLLSLGLQVFHGYSGYSADAQRTVASRILHLLSLRVFLFLLLDGKSSAARLALTQRSRAKRHGFSIALRHSLALSAVGTFQRSSSSHLNHLL